MPQLEHIEAIEKRLWTAADTLRANSNYASNEYFLPVMGLVFLRHAYSRYLGVKDASSPTAQRGGKTRALTKEDFSQQSAIFLQPKAQFDHPRRLAPTARTAPAPSSRPWSPSRGTTTICSGVLPKSEYQELDNARSSASCCAPSTPMS